MNYTIIVIETDKNGQHAERSLLQDLLSSDVKDSKIIYSQSVDNLDLHKLISVIIEPLERANPNAGGIREVQMK